MADVAVQFRYLTGLKRRIFRNARLVGNWDPQGRQSLAGSDTPMTEIIAEDGCPAFTVTVHFDASEVGKPFEWSVRLDTPVASDVRGVATEVKDANKTDRVRRFQLQPAGSNQIEEYYLTYARRLGARKVFSGGRSRDADLRFAVWAPNARNVEVVFGDPATGYIHDDGRGIDPARPSLAMAKGLDGIWQSAVIPDFAALEGQPYMYRVTNAQGHEVYRTDLFSRQQIGRGTKNPKAAPVGPALPPTLDGTKSCSLVVSLDTVARDFIPPAGQARADCRGRVLGPRVHSRAAGPQPDRRPGDLRAAHRRARRRQAGTRQPRGRDGPAAAPERPRRQRGRAAADVGVLRRRLGLRRLALLRHRIERRRPRPVQALRPRVPPARHRGDPGRRLQPLRPRRRACRVALRLRRRPRRTSTTGTRGAIPTTRTPTGDTSTMARAGLPRGSGRRWSVSCSSAARPPSWRSRTWTACAWT